MVLAQKTFSVRKNIHGKDGTPALTLVLAPLQLIFDTDTNGIVTTGSLAANTCSVCNCQLIACLLCVECTLFFTLCSPRGIHSVVGSP